MIFDGKLVDSSTVLRDTEAGNVKWKIALLHD
jgi:hypothetical protein